MTMPKLGAARYAQFRNWIEHELRRRVAARLATSEGLDPRTSTELIDQVFERMFGAPGGAAERLQFFVFAAPLMRKTILAARASRAAGGVDGAAVQQWLERLENLDFYCARIIDLHYFAGLSLKETAEALGLSMTMVVRDLRFAKAWLHVRVERLSRRS